MADETSSVVAHPITPMDQKKKKSAFWNKVIVIFIGVVMVASSIGFMMNDDSSNEETELPPNAFEVGGYTFYDLGDSFGTYIVANNQKQPIQFRLDPRNASEISMDDKAVPAILSANKIYIASDPQGKDLGNIAVAAYEISRILGNYNVPTVGAYTQDASPPDPNVPLKTCEDASNTTTVIILETSSETGVKTEGYCVHVTGNGTNIIDAADKLGMNLLGIKL